MIARRKAIPTSSLPHHGGKDAVSFDKPDTIGNTDDIKNTTAVATANGRLQDGIGMESPCCLVLSLAMVTPTNKSPSSLTSEYTFSLAVCGRERGFTIKTGAGFGGVQESWTGHQEEDDPYTNAKVTCMPDDKPHPSPGM